MKIPSDATKTPCSQKKKATVDSVNLEDTTHSVAYLDIKYQSVCKI